MSNTRQKPILTGIELSRKEDGYWLSFTTAKGNGACLRIETLKDRFGYITWKAIMEWAIEQTEQPEISIGAEMADCFDKMIGTTPKFLEPITEHPDVQRLIGQVVELQILVNDFTADKERLIRQVVALQAENKRLKGVIHDVIILTEESSTKEFAEQALKGNER